MSWPVLASALGALGFGLTVRWFLRRGWMPYTVYAQTIVFPKIFSAWYENS